MATKDEHLSQAYHNEKLAATLCRPDGGFHDWGCTVLFYSAVHYVEAFLAAQGEHSDDHADRDRRINRQPILRKVDDEYQLLKTLSQQSRYDALPVGPEDVQKAQEAFEIVRAQIKRVLGIKD